MSYTSKHTEEELTILRGLLNRGDGLIRGSLDEVIGHTISAYKAETRVVPSSNVIRVMEISIEPLATVNSSFSGGLQGDFLFLMAESNYQTFGWAVNSAPPVLEQDDSDSAMVPEWLQKQRMERKAEPKPKRDMMEVISELANRFFGVYGSVLYEKAKLGIFQGMPLASMDQEQSVLSAAIARNLRSGNISILTSLDFTVMQKEIRIWLLLLPGQDGLDAILEGMNGENDQVD
jgi:chemotaxis protein CheY-P-specific phosphatase CheC